jgi:hypothetical protein
VSRVSFCWLQGVLAMCVAYVIILWMAPFSVHDRFAPDSAAPTAAAAAAAAAAASAPAALGSLDEASPIAAAATDAPAATAPPSADAWWGWGGNSTAAGVGGVHLYPVLWWKWSEVSVGVFAAFVGGALELYRSRFVKRVSMTKDFRVSGRRETERERVGGGGVGGSD